MADCIFCQIVEGKMPSKKVYEDEYVYAFHDISPAAPTHILVIPKKHIPTIMDLKEEDQMLAGKVMAAIQKIAKEYHLDERGFRDCKQCRKRRRTNRLSHSFPFVGWTDPDLASGLILTGTILIRYNIK